jgi:glutathione synthase/RimK-type ligase-like ATP-grasp enzyme
MILLLTHSQDYYTIDGVEQHLTRFGAPYRRLNTDHFPSLFTLSVEPGGPMWLEAGAEALDLRPTRAVWARRLWPGALPAEFPAQTAASSQLQSRNFFMEAMTELDAFWINPMRASQAAESKLLQLQLARRLGLRVPATLVSSSPNAVREFAAAHPQGLITKLLLPTVQAMDGHPDFAYTTRVLPEQLDALEVIRWVPQIFQPFLRRFREYRVIVVGRDFYVGSLEIENEEVVDWRAASDADGVHWEAAELPQALRDKILQLMSDLGLVYAALDLLQESPDEEPWFLEINQAGEWGWLERDLGLPVAERLARALIERK